MNFSNIKHVNKLKIFFEVFKKFSINYYLEKSIDFIKEHPKMNFIIYVCQIYRRKHIASYFYATTIHHSLRLYMFKENV